MTSDPAGNELGHLYHFGITREKLRVTFTASDPSGNQRVCRFSIEVKGKETIMGRIRVLESGGGVIGNG